MINIVNTYIDKKAYQSVRKVLTSTYISEGKLVAKFEKQLTIKLGLINPVAVNSGTSALHLALDLAGIVRGDEVICPAQTFVATGLAILYQGAKPIFADICYETGNINPRTLEKKITHKTKAIMVVHWAGYPVDLDEVHAIARRYKLIVIEDAAHALGAVYKGKPIGSISHFTCFSFQAIKHVTTGDGGAVCCLEKKDAENGLKKRWFGIDRLHAKPSILGERQYNLDSIGYKYHLNDYGAALGLANLLNFKKRLEKRRKRASYYQQELKKIAGIKLFNYSFDRLSSFWLFGMHVERRNEFIKAMKDRNIMVSVVHQRIDRNIVLGGITKGLTNQERFDKTQIHIPIHDGLTDEDAFYIIDAIKKGW